MLVHDKEQIFAVGHTESRPVAAIRNCRGYLGSPWMRGRARLCASSGEGTAKTNAERVDGVKKKVNRQEDDSEITEEPS